LDVSVGMISMRNVVVLGAMIAAAAGASVANASVVVSATPYDLSAPDGLGVLVDFDHGLPNGFTLTGEGYLIQSGDNGLGAAPAAGPSDTSDDNTAYLSIYGGWAKLLGTTAFHNVSLFWGSMDNYNSLDLLDASGNVFKTILSADVPAGGNGDQLGGWTNQRVNIASTDSIYGVQFRSTTPAFEADNIFFSGRDQGEHLNVGGAVPEPASWALMLGGFGMVGGALRSRRRKVAFATV
jgi:hypothetical protein